MNAAAWFMLTLLVLNVGATASYWLAGKPQLAGVWGSYALAQFFWILVARSA